MDFAIRRKKPKFHPQEEKPARGGGLRDLVMGLSDGLVASFAVASGVAGAFNNSKIVIMAGLAEMLGGAISMGAAAFLSTRSQLDFYQSEVARERDEIEKWPEHEREEVRAIYQAKGFRGAMLDQIVDHITADPERWSEVMMREELGLHKEQLDVPVNSAATVGLSYLVGALTPIVPYFFLPPSLGIALSAAATVIALFAVGAAKTLFTISPWWKSGLESMAIGIVAAMVTYGTGRFFGTY
jgi:vacuolar iron transporter family protein